jgi:hypothetical protein
MEFREYNIAGKTVKVTNPRIIGIVKKAESMQSLEKFLEAQSELNDYLLGEDCKKYLTVGDYMTNMGLWEAISVECFNPLAERYASKFNLSGRFTPEGEMKKMQAWTKICRENTSNKNIPAAIVMYDGPIGNAIKGIDERLAEPQ